MKQLFVFLFCALIALTSQAREKKGVNFPEEIKVGTHTLKLNGIGVRTAMTILSVYVGGLYVATPSTDPEVLIAAATPKKIDMHFLMGVDKSKLKEGWTEGFKNNAGAYKFTDDLEKFLSHINNVKKGDRVQITLYPDKAEVQMNSEPVGTVNGAEFSKTMLKIYILKLEDTGLKKGLLGLK